MGQARFSERAVALMALVACLASLRVAVPLLRAVAANAVTHDAGEPAMLAIRAVLFLAAAVLCAVSGWRLWRGRWPDRAVSDQRTLAPLFGRNAVAETSAAKSRLRPIMAVVPFVVLAALAADHFAFPRMDVAGPGGQVAQAPANPPAAGTPPGQGAAEPATPPASPPGQGAAETPPAVAPTPPPAEAAIPPQEQPAAPPQDIATPPPQVALAPEPPQTTEPPETVAPLPAPEAPHETLPEGHRDSVDWVAVSPDGKTMLSASIDRTIKLWDLPGRKLIRDLGVHKDMARAALYLPDGTRALTAGDEGEIVLRTLPDGTVLHVFSATGHGGVRQIAISRDGRLMLSGQEAGTAIVWDLEQKSVLHVLSGHDWPVNGVAMSPDGTRAITGDIDGVLKYWDVGTGKLLRSWKGHEQGVYGAAFTPDGHHLVTGSGDYTIKLWDLDAGQEVRRFEGHSGTVYAIALSDDGQRILSGSLDGTARLWDVTTGRELSSFMGYDGGVYAVAFGPDGTVITGGRDRTIRIWRVDGAEQVAMFAGAPD
jgi:WD40 repeat protein